MHYLLAIGKLYEKIWDFGYRVNNVKIMYWCAMAMMDCIPN